jgi:hypothetical protein
MSGLFQEHYGRPFAGGGDGSRDTTGSTSVDDYVIGLSTETGYGDSGKPYMQEPG